MENTGNQIKIKYLLLSFIIIVLLYFTGTAVSIWNYGNIDEKQPTNVAIVLGAGTAYDEVSPVFKERLNHGIWLYQNGYVKKLILTGGLGKVNEHSDSYTAKQYVMKQGIPENNILIEEESSITQENLLNAKKSWIITLINLRSL